MKKRFFFKGVIFLLCIIVCFFVICIVLTDFLIEFTVEKYGTKIVGAKVELNSADISFYPLGVELDRLQVADPAEPMTNALDINKIGFSIDGFNLLRRKIIIDEMNIDDLKFNTPRKVSGAISGKSIDRSDKKAGIRFKAPTLEIPDVKTILKNEKLESIDLINRLQDDIRAEKERWKKRLDEISGKEKISEYKKKIAAIKSSGKTDINNILSAAAEAVAIQQDIKNDLLQIRVMNEEFHKTISKFKKRVSEAKKAQYKDIRRLKNKYALSPEGITNLAGVLFGAQIEKWTSRTFFWYEKIKPLIEPKPEDDKTQDNVKKPSAQNSESENLPDFLIRVINASVKLKIGEITGKIRNVTPDQNILKKPLTFNFAGESLNYAESIKLDGSLDHINPYKSVDMAHLSLHRCRLQNISLSGKDLVPIILKEGILDLGVSASLKEDTIVAKIGAFFDSVNLFTDTDKSSGTLVKSISSALSGITKFNVDADITGTLSDYKTKISSDIDSVIKDAVKSIVKNQAAALEKDLRNAIHAKLKGHYAKLEKNFDQLMPISDELYSRLNIKKNLLNELGSKSGLKGFNLQF